MLSRRDFVASTSLAGAGAIITGGTAFGAETTLRTLREHSAVFLEFR